MQAERSRNLNVGKSRRVVISVRAGYIEGDLEVPFGARGLVLFAHGSGSSRYSPRNQFVAKVIRESGNASLLFDLLTASEELNDNVTGRIRFDIELLAQRVITVTRWVASQAELARLKIGYFGSSTGAAAALVAASELRNVVHAVVSRGGRPDMAGDALERVEAPTLLIVGECDQTVVALNSEAFGKLRCEKEMKIIRNATHLFEEPGALEKVADLAAEWFQHHLASEVKTLF